MSLVGFKARNHPQQPRSDEVDDRALPQDIFNELNKRFRFTVDVAAAQHNAKLERFYDRGNCGLSRSWAGERVYCNPPYSNITPWVVKAWREVDAELIVMLLPANRTGQAWWQKHVERFRDRWNSRLRVEFLPGRIRFLKPGRSVVGPNERPLFGCALLIFEQSAP